MHPSRHAATMPDKPAIIMAATGETVTFGALEERTKRGAQMLRGFGLKTGDHIAFMLENRPAFHELFWAGQRAGLYITPISTRLTGGEIEYILRDSGAKLFVTSTAMAEIVARLSLPSIRCLMMDGVVPVGSNRSSGPSRPIPRCPSLTPAMAARCSIPQARPDVPKASSAQSIRPSRSTHQAATRY
jgi:long-chain acyl-CoA synthetase